MQKPQKSGAAGRPAASHSIWHRPAAPPQPASVQAAVGSSDAACAAAGRNPRYKVDLGNGRRIRIVLDAGKTVGDLRESAELRAREMGETRALDGFALDNKEIAYRAIEKSETLTAQWAGRPAAASSSAAPVHAAEGAAE